MLQKQEKDVDLHSSHVESNLKASKACKVTTYCEVSQFDCDVIAIKINMFMYISQLIIKKLFRGPLRIPNCDKVSA